MLYFNAMGRKLLNYDQLSDLLKSEIAAVNVRLGKMEQMMESLAKKLDGSNFSVGAEYV